MFINDVIVYGNNIEEHARRLGHVLERFDRANLKLQPGKCVFAQPLVEYLGYIVSREGIRASPDKTKAVRNFPVPRNVKEGGHPWDSLPFTGGWCPTSPISQNL